jgi:hypothetical protein
MIQFDIITIFCRFSLTRRLAGRLENRASR